VVVEKTVIGTITVTTTKMNTKEAIIIITEDLQVVMIKAKLLRMSAHEWKRSLLIEVIIIIRRVRMIKTVLKELKPMTEMMSITKVKLKSLKRRWKRAVIIMMMNIWTRRLLMKIRIITRRKWIGLRVIGILLGIIILSTLLRLSHLIYKTLRLFQRLKRGTSTSTNQEHKSRLLFHLIYSLSQPKRKFTMMMRNNGIIILVQASSQMEINHSTDPSLGSKTKVSREEV
jgi:hypothetical protein